MNYLKDATIPLRTNRELELATSYIQHTQEHIFLTGKAGTGKTTFLRGLAQITSKRFAVVAPTGVAAINAGGVTIHSFFQLSFGPQVPENFGEGTSNSSSFKTDFMRFRKERIKLIRSLDLLVIDEISMVRADLLDAIDRVLRRLRFSKEPFGGIQLLLIGDVHQLAPIARDDDWEILKKYYQSIYFFNSLALRKSGYRKIELKEIFRQQDLPFINLLNQIRENRLDSSSINKLAERYNPNFYPKEEEQYITLTTHNYQADAINQQKLDALEAKKWSFTANIQGDFPSNAYPTEEHLKLKVGAQVMFVKNDPSPEKLYYNGKIGRLAGRDGETLLVECGEDQLRVEPVSWHNMKYQLNEKTGAIEEIILGSFQQYPLRLAWAITIHKSQGLTFDRVIIDAASAFAPGQVYVALSRCTRLEGIILKTPVQSQGIAYETAIKSFQSESDARVANESNLMQARRSFEWKLLQDCFSFDGLARQWSGFQRWIQEESQSFESEYVEQIGKLAAYHSEWANLGKRFEPQLWKLFMEQEELSTNAALHKRISEAARYFLKEMEEKHDFQFTIPDLDHKEHKKRITNILDGLEEAFQMKQASLTMIQSGFDPALYLSARNKAIATHTEKRKPQRKASVNTKVSNPELYDSLKEWRNLMAQTRDVEVYEILTLRSIRELCEKPPRNRKELSKIAGIGPKKSEQFGDDLLEFIKEQIDTASTKPEKKSEQTRLNRSLQETLELLEEGASLEDIALQRQLTVSTIVGHVARLIPMIDLDLNKWIPIEKQARIDAHFKSHNDWDLKTAKEALGTDFSYDELKLMRSYLLHEKNKADNTTETSE